MFITAVIAIGVALGILVWVYSRPLNVHQVANLADHRRSVNVRTYFRFHGAPVMADTAFKQKMPARGGWFNYNCPMEIWPAMAAALFKYKKHEWIIVAFLHGRQVSRLWVNKGADNISVALPLNPKLLLEECRRGGYSSVFFHHNHPNPAPRELYMLLPSGQDVVFAGKICGCACPRRGERAPICLRTRSLQVLPFAHRGPIYARCPIS